MPGLLYSTNPWIKWHIQNRFRGDRHYVWCSEQADSRKAHPDSLAALVPRSSNPIQIYSDLQEAVRNADGHDPKINQVRALYLSLSTEWVSNGTLAPDQRDELVYMLERGPFQLWRPVLYVIPRPAVDARLQLVAPAKRAGTGLEFIIDALGGDEFDRVEFP